MENKINIAELLKDYPKGTKLYSPLCGECIFDHLNYGTIICKKQNTQEIAFTSEGYYMLPVFDDCECMIFPSKDQRDWSKFQRPFKDGDVITCTNPICSFTAIFKEMISEYTFNRYAVLILDENSRFKTNSGTSAFENPRFATEEEKQKLFQVIKDNGYRWNDETRTLEKLELVPDKFDINTLKPFDKVLVRDNNTQKWTADLFSLFDKSLIYSYSCVGHCTHQCIPYEGNEHLLGTSNDCDDFYKTW